MPITPFKIVKDDGTIDKEEYLRCIKFLEDYTSGRVKVYAGITWQNPLEIDEDSIRSSYEIVFDEIFNRSDNRLLTPECFSQLKRFIRGFVKGTYRGFLYPWTRLKTTYDTTGQYHDELQSNKPEVIVSNGHFPYINDNERTVIDIGFLYDDTVNEITSATYFKKNMDSMVFSPFQQNQYQHQQSTMYLYFGCVDDKLLRHGFENYFEERLGYEIIPTMFTDNPIQAGVQCQGFPLEQVSDIIQNKKASNRLIDTQFGDGTFYTLADLLGFWWYS